ncbi:MAG: xanthine dehydrogenase family protein molybdopterin-binding subunit [Thermoprotei archaeon]
MFREHLQVVTARATYVDDIEKDGTVFLGVYRSPVARGIVKSVTPPKNALLTLTWGDVRAYMPVRAYEKGNIARMPVLADGRVNFVGQPVLAFVVKDRYEIEDALEESGADIEPLKPIVTIEEALNGEPIHGYSNVAASADIRGGDLEQRLNAEVTVEREFRLHRVVANPIEPKGVLVWWEGGDLYVVGSFQSAFRVRADLQETLGLPPERIHVSSAPNVGGGFGNKISAYPEYVLAAMASKKLGRPVKWIETRQEHLVSPIQGRSMWARLKLYAKRDGTALGISGEFVIDGGAYMMGIGPIFPSFIGNMLPGPYKMRFIDVKGSIVYTNKPPYGAYRGAGRPEAALLHESLMEALAEELGMDPCEVRERNLVESGKHHTLPSGLKVDPAGYREVFEKAREIYGRLKSEGKRPVLITFFNYVSNPPGEGAKVVIGKGKVKVYAGSGPHGQAHQSTFAKVVSEALSLPEDVVEVELNSTEILKEGVGSFGSRTSSAGVNAVLSAVKGLLEELKTRGISLREALDSDREISYEVFAKADSILTPAAAVAYADYDPELCVPFVRELHVVLDVGRVLLRSEVEGQIVGGAAQGLAQVVYEEAEFDENGNPVYSSINDEGVPYAADVTWRVYVHPLEVYPTSLLGGARGIGEAGTSAGLAAGTLAVEKAIGKRLTEVPVKPWALCG